ncbi:MAG: hypothetical protein V7L02_12820 [Nostoc sp.]
MSNGFYRGAYCIAPGLLRRFTEKRLSNIWAIAIHRNSIPDQLLQL